MIDPMLKLHVGCPVMITENIDVEHKIANGSVATFKCVELEQNVEPSIVSLDGFCVRCVAASDVRHIEVVLDSGETKKLEARRASATAKVPDANDLADDGWASNVQRREKKLQLLQLRRWLVAGVWWRCCCGL